VFPGSARLHIGSSGVGIWRIDIDIGIVLVKEFTNLAFESAQLILEVCGLLFGSVFFFFCCHSVKQRQHLVNQPQLRIKKILFFFFLRVLFFFFVAAVVASLFFLPFLAWERTKDLRGDVKVGLVGADNQSNGAIESVWTVALGSERVCFARSLETVLFGVRGKGWSGRGGLAHTCPMSASLLPPFWVVMVEGWPVGSDGWADVRKKLAVCSVLSN